jgi:endonuclease-3
MANKTVRIKDKTRALKIQRILKKTYPEVKTQLRHANPFQLLVATILSAQCTDKQVNGVTKDLFKKLKTPHDFASASNETIENFIRPTGYFRNKAKNIKNCSKSLIEKYDGQVPQSLDELVQLPGVGRKTANVVLGSAFNIAGIVVDTHVARISKRLGFTESDNPVKIEYDLMGIIPKKNWNDFSLHLIYFGRAICKARKPACPTCPLYDLCEFPDKISKPR